MSEKSITNYHSTLHNIPEEQQYHLQHSRSLKSSRSQDSWEEQCTEGRQHMYVKFEIKTLNKRCHLEDLGISIRLTVEDEQIWSECEGLIWLAVNWDHKQAVAIAMVMNRWGSQNSGKVLHQMSNYQLVKATGVCSFNHSSNISSSVSSPCGNIFKIMLQMSCDVITAMLFKGEDTGCTDSGEINRRSSYGNME